MTRCDCHSCRARDTRRFWRIVTANDPAGRMGARVPHDLALAEARGAALRLPPVPTWTGTPREYGGA